MQLSMVTYTNIQRSRLCLFRLWLGAKDGESSEYGCSETDWNEGLGQPGNSQRKPARTRAIAFTYGFRSKSVALTNVRLGTVPAVPRTLLVSVYELFERQFLQAAALASNSLRTCSALRTLVIPRQSREMSRPSLSLSLKLVALPNPIGPIASRPGTFLIVSRSKMVPLRLPELLLAIRDCAVSYPKVHAKSEQQTGPQEFLKLATPQDIQR